MIFHLGFELPKKEVVNLRHDSESLTDSEIKILKQQIRKNDQYIHDHIDRIDLFVNKEKYPHKAKFVEKIRKRLFLLMEENDTFRKVLWKHYQNKGY